jgi:hypothetical protein
LQPIYEIGGINLGQVETERLLGVHISKDLRWDHHTLVARKKAAQIMGFAIAQRNLKVNFVSLLALECSKFMGGFKENKVLKMAFCRGKNTFCKLINVANLCFLSLLVVAFNR